MMSVRAVSIPSYMRNPLGKYAHSAQPLGVGLVAILVIAAAIFILGDSQVERSVARETGAEHERDLLRFSRLIHDSGLSLRGEQALESLPALAQSAGFDSAVDRALFGMRVTRLDVYDLSGNPVYSTTGSTNAPALSGGAAEAFNTARTGQFVSLMKDGGGITQRPESASHLLQSFSLIYDQPPGSVNSGRALMVASITTDLSGELEAGYTTLWTVVSVFFFGSLMILAVVHWAYVRSRLRLQDANDALAEQYVAVRESRERMIDAADSTKRAIAEELHGSVQTRLFALWMRVNQLVPAIESDLDRHEMKQIADELDDIRENDIRGLSHRLHPSIVRVGAVHALRSLCDRMDGEVAVELKAAQSATELEPAGTSLIPESVRLAVFRIAELAIGNTIKHASAKHCTVSWQYYEPRSELLLIVEDDGVGFDPDGLNTSEFGGLGIVNIQDYTDSINGKAVLKSEPGWGTTLTVSIPFETSESPSESTALADEHASRPGSRNVTPFDQQQAA